MLRKDCSRQGQTRDTLNHTYPYPTFQLISDVLPDCYLRSFYLAGMRFTYLLFFLATLWQVQLCLGGVVREFLQNNVAGPSVNFQQQPWPIDPEAGIRLRKDYVEMNGLYGARHVERIGLGEDGRTEERRVQQRIRDSTGGLSYQVPP